MEPQRERQKKTCFRLEKGGYCRFEKGEHRHGNPREVLRAGPARGSSYGQGRGVRAVIVLAVEVPARERQAFAPLLCARVEEEPGGGRQRCRSVG